jgi:putative DNA primase/helicase
MIQRAHSIEAGLRCLSRLRAVVVKDEELDAHPMLLNCQNGTIELSTGTLREHRMSDLLTTISPVDYSPEAKAPVWEAFLDRIFAGKRELIGFVQRAVGYTLTGDTSEQCVFIMHSSGANGKSTMRTALGSVLGNELSQTIATGTIMQYGSRGSEHDLPYLRAARMVSASLGEGRLRRLYKKRVKQLTSQDLVTGRFLYRKRFQYRPQFKLWIEANSLPKIQGNDPEIWDRIREIPFLVTIPKGERDPQLSQKLLAEKEGILAWAVRGCLAWQRDGLNPPPDVLRANQAYREVRTNAN